MYDYDDDCRRGDTGRNDDDDDDDNSVAGRS